MAQISKIPILSLCIPIYNRLSYLDAMLERFLEDKELFSEDIHLYISDNCSDDDLCSCCDKYQDMGLKMEYHRNETNIGPDGNFQACFNHAIGKYVWLLGSDDIPTKGLLRILIAQLKKDDYGLVHLSMKGENRETEIFNDPNKVAIAVSYMFTFMSANIILRESLKNIDLSKYERTYLIQVPAYINACFATKVNAVIFNEHVFEPGADLANNGGFNFFLVFVENFYSIVFDFVNKGLLKMWAYDKIKEVEYKYYLLPAIYNIITRRTPNYILKGCHTIMLKHYWRCPYAYVYPFIKFVSFSKKNLKYLFHKRWGF